MGAGFHGGFGETSGSQSNNSMPNHTNASTPREKFVNYSLDPNNANAKRQSRSIRKRIREPLNNRLCPVPTRCISRYLHLVKVI